MVSLRLGILNTEGMPNPTDDWDSSSTEKESGIRYLESGIHGVECRIQDCPGFPYTGQSRVNPDNNDIIHLSSKI